MKFGHLAVCLAALTCGGCSLLRPSCDSPGVLADVRQMMAGLKDAPSGEGANWLEKNVQIVVVSQGADQSGNQIKCEANVSVSGELFKQTQGILGLVATLAQAGGKDLSAATVHYNINFKPYSVFPLSTSLDPKTNDEAQRVQFFATIIQPAYQHSITAIAVHPPQPTTPKLAENTNPSVAIASILKPDILGENVDFLEKSVGTPKYSDENSRTYQVGGCPLNITLDKDRTVSAFDVPASGACRFNLAPFIGETGAKFSDELVVGDAQALFDVLPTWNCIHECGNAVGTTFYMIGGGGKPSNYADIAFTIDGDFSSDQLSAWQDETVEACDSAYRVRLLQAIKGVHVGHVEIGWKIKEQIENEDFQGCKT